MSKTNLTRKSIVLAGIVLMIALVMTQALGAAQGDDKPVPPSGYQQERSPFVGVAPTTEELLAEPPSIERYIAAHTLPAGVLEPANLNGSSKTASKDVVSPNGIVDYTITIVNSGDFDIPVTMTDELPQGLSYVDSSCSALITDECEYAAGTMTWKGTVPEGGTVTVTITAKVDADAEEGDKITNTAKIVSASQNLNRSLEITVGPQMSSPIQFLPYTTYGLQPDPQPVTLTAGLPNGANTWTLSWTESPGASGYEIHEATNPDFVGAVPTFVGPQTSTAIQKAPSPSNQYYYRVRSLVGQKQGPWSNVQTVIGGYRDDFDNVNTGWSMRRSTYREKVNGFYEDGKYVMQVLDRWDWGLSSPLKPAPRVPYRISFEAKIVNTANLLSFGFVFGGDWNGQPCPPGISFNEWYLHQNCFNHFYNTNNIFYGPIKLLFERVDRLEWCLDCGGSPMKRLGDINYDGTRDYNDIDPEGWNQYIIEVRQDSIRIYAAKRGHTPIFQYEYKDTRWIGSPYFGVFASTDEYNNSTWRFEYVEVMPID